jgi:hypothetical protein
VNPRLLRAGGPADNRPDNVGAVIEVPAAQRDAWQRPWADVAALLQRAQDK